MDHERPVDAGHMDEHVAVAVGDDAPGVALVGGPEDHLDADAAGRQVVGEILQARTLGGGPIAAVAHTVDEGNDLTHRFGEHLLGALARGPVLPDLGHAFGAEQQSI